MTTQTDKVLAKAAKLLALQTGKGATEAEAALAAERLQQLLEEHNLTLSQVEAAGNSTETVKRVKAGLSAKGAAQKWRMLLMETIAKNNFCLYSTTRPPGHDSRGRRLSIQYVLIGREVNVNASKMLLDYLEGSLMRVLKDSGYTFWVGNGNISKDALYFLEGAVSRLGERLTERRIQREKESEARAAEAKGNGTHRELVLAEVYGSEAELNNDFLNGFPAGTTAQRRREQEAKAARIEARFQELKAGGMEWVEAWYQSRGYGEAEARKYAASYHRSNSRRSGGQGRSQNWSNGGGRQYQKVNSSAYRAGRNAANSIGLDAQVGAGAAGKLPKA